MISPRRASLVALLLAGLAIGFVVPAHRLADASNYVMMADSLWNDGDLAYEPKDFARARRLAFADLPAGLFLVEHPGGGLTYGKPPSYALAALPFYAVFGVRGFFVLNGLLLAAVVTIGASLLAERLRWRHALPAAAVVIAASVTPAYLYWIDPFLFTSFLVAAALLAWQSGQPVLCGALLAALGSVRAPYLLLGAAPVLLAVVGRQPRRLADLALGALGFAALLAALTSLAGGDLLPYVHARRWAYGQAVPFLHGADDPGQGRPVDHGSHLDPATWPGAADLALSNLYFWAGRFGGILPYFPGFFACLLWTRHWRSGRTIWLVATIGVCIALQVILPHSFQGGGFALGNRYFVFLPVAFLMVDRRTFGRIRAIVSAALLALAVPIAIAPGRHSTHAGSQMLEAPYRWFPFEWTQAAAIRLPVRYPGRVFAITDRQHAWEPARGGFWTAGDSRSELVFVRKGEGPPAVRLSSRLSRAVVYDGTERSEITLAPESEVAIELRHPMARYVDTSHPDVPRVTVYRLVVEAPGGFRPSDRGDSEDDHHLGVFVRPVR